MTHPDNGSGSDHDGTPPECNCTPDGCNGEGYEPDDPRTCVVCRDLDGEMPCPADPSGYELLVELLMDEVEGLEFKPAVLCADGSEPFASLDLGHGLVVDLTAQVRRARPAHTTDDQGELP